MLAIQDISNKLTFDLLILKVVSESRETWATSVPILVFLGLSVLELGPMYTTDRRQTDVRQKHRLMPPPYGGVGVINFVPESRFRVILIASGCVCCLRV